MIDGGNFGRYCGAMGRMNMVRIILRKLCITGVMLLLLGACSSIRLPFSSTPTPAPTPTPTPIQETVELEETAEIEPTATPVTKPSAVIVGAAPVNTLDPYRMVRLHPDGSIAAHIWDTLIWVDDNLELAPGLANSWKLVNNLTWEVELRQGITFHNGEPVNSEAVRFSVERSRTLPVSLETFATAAKIERVEVIDDLTVSFRTSEPVANFPYYLSSLEILPPGYYTEHDQEYVSANPVGSGPYRFVEQRPDGDLILEAAPEYWAGQPVIDRLVFRTVTDSSLRLDELVSNRADLVTDLTYEQVANWNDSWGRLEAIESTRRLFIGMRVQEGTPLADEKVRQALNYALDIEAIVDNVLGGYGQRYGSWVNPPYSNLELPAWPHDVEKARSLLVEAGYDEGLMLVLDAPKGRYGNEEAILQAVAAQLSEAGIEVEIRFHDWPTYVENYLLAENMGSLFFLGLNSRANGLEDVRNLSLSFPFNLTNWQNAEFEQLLREAQYTFNPQQRQVLLDEAQSIAYREAPWIWLWRQYYFYGVSDDLEWTPRADGLVYLYRPVPLTTP